VSSKDPYQNIDASVVEEQCDGLARVLEVCRALAGISQEHVAILEGVLSMFRVLGRSFEGSVASHLQESRRGGKQWNAVMILPIMFVAAGLKRYSDLPTIAYRLMKILLPPELQTLAPDLPKLRQSLPGRTTLFRYQIILDAAYMLYMRLQPLPQFIFLCVDSSPQGGRDWLLCHQSRIMSERAMLEAGKAVRTLVANPIAQGGLSLDRRLELGKVIATCFCEHAMPIVALGARFAGLVDKMSALAHAVCLEVARDV
jgi:hypothetical protein